MADDTFIPGVTAGAVPAPIAAPSPAPVVPAPAPTLAPAAAPIVHMQGNTGDAMLDVAVSSFSKAYGVTEAMFNSTMGEALSTGDLSKLDRATLVGKLGIEGARQAEQLAQAFLAKQAASEATAASTVHTVAGSAQVWQDAVRIFNSSQPAFVIEQVDSLLRSGDTEKVKYGAQQLLQLAKAGGAGGTLPMQPGGFSGGTGGLSAEAFRTEISALRKEAGNRSLETGPFAVKYQALIARRQLGASAGL